MKRVTGIGGIFFKSKNPNATKEWYAKHLGFNIDQWGAAFTFRKEDAPDKKGYLQWSPFADDTDYFQPSDKEFMINYRVENLEVLVNLLREEGVTICDEIASYDYGKFVHIMDSDGNKIELWEPIDEVFDQLYQKTEE
jgi:predicted enzyme related to lactoylglutathione lyase